VFGHIHEAQGVEVVEWDLSMPSVSFECSVKRLEDGTATSTKLFLVDLSLGAEAPLENDGSKGDLVPSWAPLTQLSTKGPRSSILIPSS
jgi:hypothetical protein